MLINQRVYLASFFRNITSIGTTRSISVPVTKTVTNAAAKRAEKTAAAESTLETELKEFTMDHIATSLQITEEVFNEVDYITDLINTELPLMLRAKLDEETWSTISGATGVNTQDIQIASGAVMEGYADIARAANKVRTGCGEEPSVCLLSPSTFLEVFLKQLTASSAIIDPSVAIRPNVLGLPVYQPLGLFSELGTADAKVGLVAHVNRWNRFWTEEGMTIERGMVNNDFLEWKTRYRAGIRTSFLMIQPKAFTVLEDGR